MKKDFVDTFGIKRTYLKDKVFVVEFCGFSLLYFYLLIFNFQVYAIQQDEGDSIWFFRCVEGYTASVRF